MQGSQTRRMVVDSLSATDSAASPDNLLTYLSMNQSKFLSVPEAPSVRFERNLIDVAVCEFRFPTLLELESKPPLKLQSQLRKKYPFYEKHEHLDKSNLEGVHGRYRYLFRSKKNDWTIAVHAGAASLETNRYTDFDDFLTRLTELLDLLLL